MSELIRREDAIKATWQEPSYTDPYNILTEVRDRINAIPAASPWHNADDELPDGSGRVLVYVGVNYCGEGMHNEVMTAVWSSKRKQFFVEADDGIRGPIIGEVTHWMRLPEPPKEDA